MAAKTLTEILKSAVRLHTITYGFYHTDSYSVNRCISASLPTRVKSDARVIVYDAPVASYRYIVCFIFITRYIII